MNLVGTSANFTAVGTAELNTGNNGPLVLQVSVTASTLGNVRLDVSTTDALLPLPDLLPDLSVLLTGSFTSCTDESMSVEGTGTAVSSIPLFDLLEDATPMFRIHLSCPGGTGTSTLTASFDAAGELNLISEVSVVRDLSASMNLVDASTDFTASARLNSLPGVMDRWCFKYLARPPYPEMLD